MDTTVAFDLRVISLGAGVQSSTMYRRAALGDYGVVPDYAIFADTQQEPKWVYEQLDQLEHEFGDVIPILRATGGDLGEMIKRGVNQTGHRFPSVPFWVEGADGTSSPGRRQCSREMKIDVIQRKVRDLLGLKKRQRAKGRFLVEEWVGISTDEIQRAKPARYDWVVTRWPLLYDIPMNRQQCIEWTEANGYSVPKKSACVFCPYRPALEYSRWRDEEPELFEEACRWDDLIRSSFSGRLRGMRNPSFILKARIPMRELPPTEELEGDDGKQMDLFNNECEGMCGV